ncbi:DUF1822 family protein [Crocosphaera watsonii]|uniref:DUF1822 family protein n=2 Tax=Crocosphaera watsonii TaxID=263511 RepID=UPI0006514DDC|nr:DUF1822 family protein [Crocosphaera watsonii]
MNHPLIFTVPLSYEAHENAERCVESIKNPDKLKQVYLNSLAVYSVNYYLQLMGLETEIEKSYSQDPIAVQLSNIADLSLKNIGKVECCPVLPDENKFNITADVSENRLAYIAVQFTESLKQGTILGYVENPLATVEINQLQTLEDLLLYLSTLEIEAKSESKLGKWLEGIVEEGWQRVEELFTPQQLGLAFMNEVSVIRGQELDLGIQLNQVSVALVTKVTQLTNTEEKEMSEADILMQVRPISVLNLPSELMLQIKDSSGEIVLETSSREGDNWIQLAFSAEYGESFQVLVSYEDAVITKNFVI